MSRNLSKALATAIESLFLPASACVVAAGPQPPVGPVIGVIDDIR
jgi:hypothetical protein